MDDPKKLVIVGDTAFAEVAYEYFTHDSPYDVVSFSVEKRYLTKTALFGLPVCPLEDMRKNFAPADVAVFVAVTYKCLNRLRTRLMEEVRLQGYRLASYISSKAFVWPNASIGSHCFVFEDNTIQPFANIGSNVILWSGNHIGHHSDVKDNCFVSSHVVVSGYAEIGNNCFLGVNSTISNNVKVGNDCMIGAGAVITCDVASDSIVRPAKCDIRHGMALRLFGTI